MNDSVSVWMHRHGCTSLCVISPHFDDAVYSAFGALTTAGLRHRVVATAVTTAPEHKKTWWASQGGFADTHVEHLQRSGEDRRVLGGMDVEANHMGGESENAAAIAAAVKRFGETFVASREGYAYLVPAGAGLRPGFLQRLRLRAGLKVGGVLQHAEHVLVRDLVLAEMRRLPKSIWGFYAENPYLTSNNEAELQRHLESIAARQLMPVSCRPDVSRKLVAAEGYASQAGLVMGETGAERLAFVARPELLLLPVTA